MKQYHNNMEQNDEMCSKNPLFLFTFSIVFRIARAYSKLLESKNHYSTIVEFLLSTSYQLGKELYHIYFLCKQFEKKEIS